MMRTGGGTSPDVCLWAPYTLATPLSASKLRQDEIQNNAFTG